METIARKVLIVCDSSRSLLQFRGKLIEDLLLHNKVFVFTPRIQQPAIKAELDRLGVVVYQNSLQSSNVSIASDLRYLVSLYKIIRQVKPDVLFPYAFKPVIYSCLVGNVCNVKKIVPMLTGLGYNFDSKSRGSGIVKAVTRNLLKLSLSNRSRTRVILQNFDDQQTLLKYHIINSQSKTTVVNGSGVDLSHYEYSQPDCENITFLMMSRLINGKGIREYYEAAKLLRSKFPWVKCQLIGAYDDNIDVIDDELYRNIRSGTAVEYLGEVEDVRPYIKKSSVVVLPSYYGEGVPRCILEGMAMGRAILTTDSVGCKETICQQSENKNGFLVPTKNSEALAAKMEHFVKNSEDILRFGINGRKYASERFDVVKVNQQMLSVLEG